MCETDREMSVSVTQSQVWGKGERERQYEVQRERELYWAMIVGRFVGQIETEKSVWHMG